MEIIVQKFGGTSVATKKNRKIVAEKIINAKNLGKNPVVVVSAIGRRGDPYATDTLIDFSNSVYPEVASRELDLIMSCGETISSVIMSNTIKSMGYKAIALTGYQAGIITDETFGNAEILYIDPRNIINLLNQNYIVVVTGFQGITKNKDVTTLGRGGSDTTAVVIGDALKCNMVEIYTDVDGVMTADPKIVPEANTIEYISFGEMYQMAKNGAKIIHSKAIDIAIKKNIPLKIKNTFSNSKGTIIDNNKSNNTKTNLNNIITAICHKINISQIIFNYNPNIERELLKLLDKEKIRFESINFLEQKIQISVDEKDLNPLIKILNYIGVKDYEVLNQLCKLSLIGKKINYHSDMILNIIELLKKNNITILQFSNNINNLISILIREKDLINAANILHKNFIK